MPCLGEPHDTRAREADQAVRGRGALALTVLAAALAIVAALAALSATAASGPKRGKTVLLKLGAGTVQYKAPNTGTFKSLKGSQLVAVKTLVDAREGAVLVMSARDDAGH